MGLIFVPVTVTAVSGVDPQDSGVASAVLNVGQQIGGTIGLSALVTIFSTAARHDAESQAGKLSGTALAHHVFTHGADMGFRAGAIFAFGALIVALTLIRFDWSRTRAERPEAPVA
jgi:hypothetical protein